MSEPTEPGYYWAKDKLLQCDDPWEIVRVADHDGTFYVLAHGLETEGPLSDFTFGPEVTKPEGLK